MNKEMLKNLGFLVTSLVKNRLIHHRLKQQKNPGGNFGKAEENPKRTNPTRREDPVRSVLIKSVKAKINPSNP